MHNTEFERRKSENAVCWILYCKCHILLLTIFSIQLSSVAQSCLILCDPMDYSRTGLQSIHHQLSELSQTHIYWVSDAIQPSHPLLSTSHFTFNLSQHQDLFKWVSFSHQVAKYWSFSFSISKVSKVAQSCLTLCDPMDYSLPGSFIHEIFQARVLKWVDISFSRSSWLRDWTQVSCIAGRQFTSWATREVPPIFSISPSKEYSGLISFRMDLLDLLAVQGTFKRLLQCQSLKASIFGT